MIRRYARIVAALAWVLVASGCSLFSIATPTPALSPTPTQAPADARTWAAAPVLIALTTAFEDPVPSGVSRTPAFILYADGRLVRSQTGLQVSSLSRKEVCQLLFTIEQAGFFTFDMAPYTQLVENAGFGMTSSTTVVVNAWEQRSLRAEALREVSRDPELALPVALETVYALLTTYTPAEAQPYRSEQAALSIERHPTDETFDAPATWPLETPSLASLYERAVAGNVRSREVGWGLLLEGAIAKEVLQSVAEADTRIFAEAGVHYSLAARYLLPYESLESAVAYVAHIPSPDVPTSTQPLTCYLSDGVVE